VGGIDGAMDEVEFNNQKGFAFNGFLSKFSPPGQDASAKNYAEELKNDFPNVNYSEATGGTASKPTKTETLILPTDKWHEAFLRRNNFLIFRGNLHFQTQKAPTAKPNKTATKRKPIL